MLSEEYREFLESFLRHGETFVKTHCRMTGDPERIRRGELDMRFIGDYRSFTFSKSTKLLRSVLLLLDAGQYEDALVLTRTMFECYLSSRYVDDRFDLSLVRDMIVMPMELAKRTAIQEGDQVTMRESGESVEFFQRLPSVMDLGKDRRYFYDLYLLLCNYAHCNFSQAVSYLNEERRFDLNLHRNEELAHLIPLFVFCKMFESVVLLEQVRFDDPAEEAACCQLVTDATVFLEQKLRVLSKTWEGIFGSLAAKHQKKVFNNMRTSLSEQLGRVEKSFLGNHGKS